MIRDRKGGQEVKVVSAKSRECVSQSERVEGRSARLRDRSSDGDNERDTAKMIAKTQWDPN